METEPMVIHDRIAAIEWAIGAARAGDTVLVAGKGHEQDQQVGDLHIPMNDRATVAQALGLAA
jgi:UDP-N-acetylmuramoyl-L-alanyl-D-glutamate--2,6-diaminopimelate ligase